MSKNEVSYKSKLPKIKNIFSYTYFCVSKIVAIVCFGVGAIILGLFVFPFIRLFTLHKKDFGIIARAYVSHTFRVFLGNLDICKTSVLKVEDKQAFRNIHSKIIIANHPSLLDFVYQTQLVLYAAVLQKLRYVESLSRHILQTLQSLMMYLLSVKNLPTRAVM